MLKIAPSHGGRDTTEQYAEALGAYLLALNGYGNPEFPRKDERLFKLDDIGHHFQYNGRHYRAIWGKELPGTPAETLTLHFDYVREDTPFRDFEELGRKLEASLHDSDCGALDTENPGPCQCGREDDPPATTGNLYDL